MTDFWLIVWLSFASFLVHAGPGVTYGGPCAALNDLDKNGTIDLRDVAIFQNGYSCTGEGPAICGFYYSPGPTK
jgi:hypothetical protein